ncbi:MAG: thioredoxin domain-containing protein [Chloroflexi bacterium]|nr:thioredoxin domain-containing protein [Chloroflexota bacterium]
MLPAKIQWGEWGEEAFAQAKRDDKPILLSISGVWCHWCHVMDGTSYEDDEAAELINTRFIPIRVDTDRRPDINRRYNMGGWPTTAFLTPDGEVLWGATYLPPEQFRQVLKEISVYYQDRREEISRQVQEVMARRSASGGRPAGPPKAGEVPLSPAVVNDVQRSIEASFDRDYGGFGDQPKFPHSEALELALARYHRTRDVTLRRIVVKTLVEMSAGGIYDAVEGGFFRYSTTRDWSIPHFEKMLEDNAKHLAIYLDAYQLLDEAACERTAQDILRYVESSLRAGEEGGFWGSQNADEEYYALNPLERLQRESPSVDTTLYTDWNARMAFAYLSAAQILGRPELAEHALRTLDRLWVETYRAGQGVAHYLVQGGPQLPGLLGDQAHLIWAFLHAYQQSGRSIYFDRAQALIVEAESQLWDEKEGGFFDRPAEPDALGGLRWRDKPLEENALMARALLRLSRLTHRQEYVERARRTLEFFLDEYPRYGIMAAGYALAVMDYLESPVEVAIVGVESDPRTQALLAASLRGYEPRRVAQVLDPQADGSRLNELGYLPQAQPVAYVCFNGTCAAPITDPESIPIQVQAFLQRAS